VFGQWLQYHKDPTYKIWQINVYPTATNAVQVVTTLAYAWSSDSIFRGARWPPMIIGGCVNVMVYVSLAIWNIPDGWRWACYIMIGFGGGLSGLWFAWCHEICGDDNEERAFVGAAMNEIAYVCQAWLPLIIWQQVDAPEYRKGFISVACISVLLMATAMTTRTLHNREIKWYATLSATQERTTLTSCRKQDNAGYLEDSSSQSEAEAVEVNISKA